MSAAGPSASRVNSAANEVVADADIRIIDVTDAVTRHILASERSLSFFQALGDGAASVSIIGIGDTLDVGIWEAPPAALFSAFSGISEMNQGSSQVARSTTMPAQVVDTSGRISLPFVGSVSAVGKTPEQLASVIVGRLRGMAHDPQVIVRIAANSTRNVTVVGDLGGSARIPLTAKGERLLDVIAAAGGGKQPVNKTTIQVSRGGQVHSMPLTAIINDPRQNIRVQPDDVVTALFQPYSFTALGATGANAEIPLEGTGVTLSQALGRVGGLQDQRASIRGVFLFRLENPEALDPAVRDGARLTPDGRVPVIYRIDMKNPATFFVAQSFLIRDKDVLYVSNAPMADLQKFVNIVSSVVIPVVTVQNATNRN